MPLTPAADEISDFLKNLLINNHETVSQNYGIVLLQRNDDTSLLSLHYDFWNLWHCQYYIYKFKWWAINEKIIIGINKNDQKRQSFDLLSANYELFKS